MDQEQAQFLMRFLVEEFKSEIPTTRKVFLEIPEGKKDFRIDPKARTAFEIAWHIASSELWFLNGIINGEFASGEESAPSSVKTVKDIITWYDKEIPSAIEKIIRLSPEILAKSVSFFSMPALPVVTYLSWLIKHSVHHRAQLATCLRPMGGKVPSIYGGSADEPWQPPA